MKRLLLWTAVVVPLGGCPGCGDDDVVGGGDAERDSQLLCVDDVTAPVRRSPAGDAVAVGFPPALVVNLATGTPDVSASAGWVESYLDPQTDEVLVWEVGSDEVNTLGPAVAIQQDDDHVFVQRDVLGPFVRIDKVTLEETLLAERATNLVVNPTYATLEIDGALTIVSPRTIPLGPAFVDHTAFASAAGHHVLFRVFGRQDLVDLDTGRIFELNPTRTPTVEAIMLSNGVIVRFHPDGGVVEAVEFNGSSRTLCAAANGFITANPQQVLCRSSFDGVATVVGLQSATVVDASDTADAWLARTPGSYAFANGDDVRVVLGSVERRLRRSLFQVRFNSDGTAAGACNNDDCTITSAATASTVEMPWAARLLRLFVVATTATDTTIVSLDDMTTVTVPALQVFEDATTGTVFTVELQAGEVRPALHAFVPGRGPREVKAGVDRVVFAEQNTAVVVVDEVGNASGDNGTCVVHVEVGGER